ncbi:metallophosphoesterase [Bacillus altitudinis]|uniref:metallophosphoesterase n=1 Tax=Bacillus altitudinis TaxID=293387 RepID=UPI002E2101E7|nr:metallophosphoesterase [Bacillus altitudinis]MED4560490.1 metallophosphoesterase [Bacillus altitudinis]
MVNVSRQIILFLFLSILFCFSQPASAGSLTQTQVNIRNKPFSPFIFDQFQVDVRPVQGKKRDLQFRASISQSEQILSANLYYKQSDELGYRLIPMERLPGMKPEFTAKIPTDQLWNPTVHYYTEFLTQKSVIKTTEQAVHLNGFEEDLSQIPELLMTEIVVNSKNRKGKDAFEFIEVYNTTHAPISLRHYQLRYRNPAQGVEMDDIYSFHTSPITISPGKPYVFWLRKKGQEHLTVADFNAMYKSHLKEGEQLSVIESKGLSNSKSRLVSITTNIGEEVSSASYRLKPSLFSEHRSLLFKYPMDGTTQMKLISKVEEEPTPGKVLKAQIPTEKKEISQDVHKPVIEDMTDNQPIKPTEGIEMRADVQDDQSVKTVKLRYRTNRHEDFKEVLLQKDHNDRLFHYIIYSPELIGKDRLEYQIEASDGENQAMTMKKTIDVEQVSKAHGLRLNVEEGDTVSGVFHLKATADQKKSIKLMIDGKPIRQVFPALEADPYLAFDVKGTNLYFKNGVSIGKHLLSIFDDSTKVYRTYTIPIPEKHLEKAGPQTISFHAGTKSSPFDRFPGENHDDFELKNVQMILSNGTQILPLNASQHEEWKMGDGGSAKKVRAFQFQIPKQAYASSYIQWDTRRLKEGVHVVQAKTADESQSVRVKVDNTGPKIKSNIQANDQYKGVFTLKAKVTDRWSDIAEMKAYLDGKPISLPYQTSSSELEPGEHTLKIKAKDAAGNKSTLKKVFKTVHEHPETPERVSDRTKKESSKQTVLTNDPTNDQLDYSFYRAYQYTSLHPSMKIYKYAAETEPPKHLNETGEMIFSDRERNRIAFADGKSVETKDLQHFPYHRFQIKVHHDVREKDVVEAVWKGSSLSGRKVTMYAWNHQQEKWDKITHHFAKDEKEFYLKGLLSVRQYMKNQTFDLLVQDEISQTLKPYKMVWMSDTQYYARSYPHIFKKMVEWIRDQRDPLNIQYVFHTGDIVDDSKDKQWNRADTFMRVLDQHQIPYGVLAGNHDVRHKDGHYREYGRYFGAKRFEDKPYYGESYQNNRGHYDLISAGGNDYMMVYMGWGIKQNEIDWLNRVISEYPDRIVILNFHEYLLVSGNRSPIGDLIFHQVVKRHPNIVAVFSGHYHGASRKVDEIDDDHDGKVDRKVYQILADYQSGPEGGQGFMRLITADQEKNKLHFTTYSPYLNQEHFYDPKTYGDQDEFSIDVDLTPKMKSVKTNYFELNVYTNVLLGEVKGVKSGKKATFEWKGLKPNQEYYWYTVAKDRFEGKAISPIWKIHTKNDDQSTFLRK